MNRLQNRLFRPFAGVAAVGLIIVSALSAISTSVEAASSNTSSDQHLITLHDRGQERGILTHAATLREAFKEADLYIDENDLVEPGLDEKLTASNYEANIYRARPIIIIDGSTRQKVMSAYQTGEQIATHANVTLHDEDTTTIDRTDDIVSEGAGLKLTVNRATPFTLILYGKKLSAYSQANTVGEMLKNKGITLASDDTLSVTASTPLVENMTVEVWRNGVQTITEEQEIAMPIRQVKDADKEVGYKQVQTAGKAGKKQVTYEVNLQNGNEVSRKEIQSVVSEQPTEEVVVIGAKVTNTFSGDFAGALARLRSCEGSYTSNTGNGYYGAYQYDIQTWGGYQGYPNAAAAPPAVQDQKAWETYQRRGWQPWPSCKVKMGLQDIYR